MDKCNHCNSTNISFNTIGRSEWWYCKDCKKEVSDVSKVEEAPVQTEDSWNYKGYGLPPGLYGFDGSGENDGSNYFFDEEIDLPTGNENK